MLAKLGLAGLCSQDPSALCKQKATASHGSEWRGRADRGELSCESSKESIQALHEFLVQKGHAWKMKLSCALIGVHPGNRDGIGCSVAHVAELITDIHSIGFVAAESKGVCVEVPADGRGDHIRQFNLQLASEAFGKLAPVDCASLKYASIIGSHANQANRCFKAGVAHEDPKVTVDGFLSLTKLAQVDPSWHAAIQDGLEGLVISHDVTESHPDYVRLAQAAGNASGQIASVEHELQLARKVTVAIDGLLKRSGKTTVVYNDVAPDILRSRPPSASALPGIFMFVLKCGGGLGADSFFGRSERHIRAHGQPKRALGPEVWQALAMEVKGKCQYVPWRHMLLKLGFTGPERTLTSSDVKKALQSNVLAKAAEAEKMASEMQRILSSATHLTPEVAAATLAEVEIEFAAVLLQKRKVSQRTSLESVCNDCLQGLGMSSPWAHVLQSSSSTQAPAQTSPSKDSEAGMCSVCPSKLMNLFVGIYKVFVLVHSFRR